MNTQRNARYGNNREGYIVLGIAVGIIAILALAGRMSAAQVIVFAVLLPSIILHEIAHGWIARFFGDDTAARAGRLTLNPAAHVDPIGTLVMPILCTLSGNGFLGWAKPVPVSVFKLRNPRVSSLLVSLGGPATNICLAFIAAVLFKFFNGAPHIPSIIFLVHPTYWFLALFYLGVVNIWLAMFNMLPIPPLDGSAVVEFFLPRRYWPQYLSVRRYSQPIFIVVILLSRNMSDGGPLGHFASIVQGWWIHFVN